MAVGPLALKNLQVRQRVGEFATSRMHGCKTCLEELSGSGHSHSTLSHGRASRSGAGPSACGPLCKPGRPARFCRACGAHQEPEDACCGEEPLDIHLRTSKARGPF